jgi:hypothetical protein
VISKPGISLAMKENSFYFIGIVSPHRLRDIGMRLILSFHKTVSTYFHEFSFCSPEDASIALQRTVDFFRVNAISIGEPLIERKATENHTLSRSGSPVNKAGKQSFLMIEILLLGLMDDRVRLGSPQRLRDSRPRPRTYQE